MGSAAVAAGLLIATVTPSTVVAAGPVASSSFAGAENPLNENGAWVHMFSMSPDRVVFQKNNGAFAGSFNSAHNNHPAARPTAAIPTDHYSEIVVGHIGNNRAYVGPMVRVQTSGPAVDSQYTWWGSVAGGDNNFLYRFVCDGTSYKFATIVPHSPIADGDRLRLIARGPLVYGIKNGAREFIYNTGRDPIRFDGGTAGILAYVQVPPVTDATIASWSAGAAPASSGTWASSTFAGAEDPLDEGDRWYPLPGYSGFKKAGGGAVGKDGAQNISGVWSIAPPAKQYSEVTLATITSGGGGPVVRIDRSNFNTTGWLLFIFTDSPSSSGIYKIVADGQFTPVRFFTPTTAPGDRWRLTADGNTLEVFQNGVSQFTYTTDGSYPTGDVGIMTYTPAFTFSHWEGGETNSTPPAAPTITGFAPPSGPVGTSVQISGTNFTAASSVTFNNVGATYTVTSDTAIQATVPASATTGPISVTTSGGTASSTSNFTVTSPPPAPPTISDFAPASGPVGTSVQVNGTNFSGASSVKFNNVAATYAVSSPTVIQATVPSGAGSGPISVTTAGGTTSSTSNFTVTSPPPAPPTISDFAPASGPVGTSVQINGTNFSGASSVTFNSVGATYTVISDTTIQATVPSAATTGLISVTTDGGTVSSVSSFTVTASPPTISGFAPASGPVGTSVQINGTNFNGTSSVTFNTKSATYSVTSPTTIQATVPSGATTGLISVTTDGGTVSSVSNFTVTASPPTISGFAPASGPVGTSVQLIGTNFSGASSVTFNTKSATYSVTSPTTIQATVPSGATSGPISVTTPGGTANSTSNFTVTVSPPTITNFTPASGPVGTSVRINGTNFSGASAVQFNGVNATYTVTSPTTIQATVPATATTGPISVTTPGGAATSTGNFTVMVRLTVTKTSPVGVGNGTVTSTSSPASANQIDCGPTCSVEFAYGTVVTLTATPAFLSVFNGWDGCDSSSGTSCTLTIKSASTVTAHFLP